MEKLLARGTKLLPAVAGIVGAGDLVRMVTDPVEQQQDIDRLTDERLVSDPRRKVQDGLNTAALLLPWYQTIRFRSRDKEIQDYLRWCREPSANMSVRLVTGGSGRGKTRLMVELCGKLRDDDPTRAVGTGSSWSAGFLTIRDKADYAQIGNPFEVPFASTKNLCIVIDYAENKIGMVLDQLSAAARSVKGDGNRTALTRIILIARQKTEAFDGIRKHEDIGHWDDLAPQEDALASIPEPEAFFQSACEDLEVPENCRTFPEGLDANAADTGILALSALLARYGNLAGAKNQNDILDRILDHEERYWRGACEERGMPPELLSQTADTTAAALFTLYGLQRAIADENAAAGLLSAHKLFEDQNNATRLGIAKTFAGLYPQPGGRIEGVALDLLGDRLVEREAAKDPSLFTPVDDAAHVTGQHFISALTRLTWIGRRDLETGTALMEHALAQAPDRIARTIIALAPALGDPLGLMSANWIAQNLAPKAARSLVDSLPPSSLALREFSCAVTQAALKDADNLDAAERAGLFNNLANRLSELGRREEALDAAQEAAERYRELARQRTEAFTQNLAMSLNNLAAMLSGLGRREDALDVAQEAADLYRDLARQRPEAFTPNLAASLNNLAAMLSGLGRREDALDAAQEAVDIRRELARKRPDAFTPDLSMSLSNLAIRLSALGRRQDALEAAQEAVDIRRKLARQRPDAFTPDLALSLNNLAGIFSALGRREDALDAAQEAVDLRRGLARQKPEAFTPDLALSLNNLAIRLSGLGRQEDALEAAQEAVNLYRKLARQRPDAFTPKLAGSLNTLANRLSDLGRREEALESAVEAVDIRRGLARQRPDAFTPELALSLNNLATMLSELGRREDALDAAQEAVDLRRELARQRPDAFTPDLSMSLGMYTDVLISLERKEDAFAAITEAITLLRPHFLALPPATAKWMAMHCRRYVSLCEELGKDPDAELLGPIIEAIQEMNSSGEGE